MRRGLLSILLGFAKVMDMGNTLKIRRNDILHKRVRSMLFRDDIEMLAEDWHKVGRDISTAMRRFESRCR